MYSWCFDDDSKDIKGFKCDIIEIPLQNINSKYMETFSYPIALRHCRGLAQVQIQTRQTPIVSKFALKKKKKKKREVIQIPMETSSQYAQNQKARANLPAAPVAVETATTDPRNPL